MAAQVEAAIRKEAVRRGRYGDHVDAVRLQCLEAERAEEEEEEVMKRRAQQGKEDAGGTGGGTGGGSGGAEGQRASAGRRILVVSRLLSYELTDAIRHDSNVSACWSRSRTLCQAPKVLLVVSHWPILRFMKKWLSQVYVLSMMQNPVPLERCIEHFVYQVSDLRSNQSRRLR